MNEHLHSLPVQEYTLSDARVFLSKVYLWMAATLGLTGAVAWYSTQNEALLAWTAQNIWIPVIATLGIVLIMNFMAHKLTSGALTILLIVFAALEGLLFGPILLAYTQESLALTFSCTAGMFGVMGLFGAFTKVNLSGMGRTLMMILIGLIIAMIANMLWGNSTMDLIISGVGVILFAAFTAYDTQHILAIGMCEDEDIRRKGAVLGTMCLYLDFINLFLFLLRFLGNRED